MIASDALSQQIIGVIVRVERLPPEHVTIDTAFSDLGLDSLPYRFRGQRDRRRRIADP